MPHCEFSGLGPRVKNLVSHSNRKTKSRVFPNVHKKTFYSLILKKTFRARVAAQALRDMDRKGGVDAYLMKQEDKKLSPPLVKIKKSLLRKTSGAAHEAQN